MKKLFVLGTAVALAINAMATTVYVDQVSGYFSTDGEFNISPITGNGYAAADLYNNNLGQLGFGTFCIERNASITVPGTYTATVIPSGVDPIDGVPIAIGTAWLFSQFAHGTLAGYNYTPGVNRVNSAYALQLAIWTLEGGYSFGSLAQDRAADSFLQTVANQFGGGDAGLLAAMATLGGAAYDVGVLQLQNANGGNVQPMLTLLPDGGSALILLGMGLSCLTFVARKFRA
jgi:hypothetical protein